jgi:hypothetical protein
VKRPRRIWLVTLVLIVAVLAGIASVKHFQIAAAVWHWRHGYTTHLQEYEIPVPEYWPPENFDEPDMMELVNTRLAKREGPMSRVSVISVSIRSTPIQDIKRWRSFSRQSLERQGMSDIQEMALQAGDEKIDCIGGHALRAILHIPSINTVSLECMSSGRLEIGFSGPPSGLVDFQAIVSNIRERR